MKTVGAKNPPSNDPSSRLIRSIGVVIAASFLASTILGCPLLKKKTDDEDPTIADAATVAVSGTGAKNEANIIRYANEVPIANEPAVIGKDGAKARNFPGNGPEVATLPKGTVVAKMASYFSTGVLIMFDDPSGDGSKLMGWVSPKSFDVTAPTPTKIVVVPKVDAGAKATVDAGTQPTPGKDGGGGGSATADAGGSSNKPPEPAKGLAAVSPIEGKCPWDGWALAEIGGAKMCRRKCTKDGDPICPRNTKCVSNAAGKVCATGL